MNIYNLFRLYFYLGLLKVLFIISTVGGIESVLSASLIVSIYKVSFVTLAKPIKIESCIGVLVLLHNLSFMKSKIICMHKYDTKVVICGHSRLLKLDINLKSMFQSYPHFWKYFVY